MCGWRLLPQALPAESTALEPKIVRSRMKPSCGRRFGQGDVEPEFTKLAGEARGEAGAVAPLEVVGAEVLVGDAAAEHPVDGGQDRGRDGDRKSTRLNSSHMSISYAVFCLKKKKKI